MKLLLMAAVLSLAACASNPLQAIKAEVDGQLTYQNYNGRDFTPRRSGSGNCAVFAASYQEAARQQGIAGEVRTCLLINGQGHAYFKTANGVLDVRQPRVEDEADVGCLPGSVRVVGAAVAFR